MASSSVKTYSADQVKAIFAGVVIDSGYDDGEFVSIEMVSDDFGSKAGADGEVARWKTNDRRANIKMKLLQTSQGNDALNQARNLGLAGANGADVGVFELVEIATGNVLAHADKAWISKAPTVSRAREVGPNEWSLQAAVMVLNPIGSPVI